VVHKKAAGLVTAAADYETRICATGKQHKSNKLKSHETQAIRADLIGCARCAASQHIKLELLGTSAAPPRSHRLLILAAQARGN
jgi:hypothetical protein